MNPRVCSRLRKHVNANRERLGAGWPDAADDVHNAVHNLLENMRHTARM
jgi:hypothetical protein